MEVIPGYQTFHCAIEIFRLQNRGPKKKNCSYFSSSNRLLRYVFYLYYYNNYYKKNQQQIVKPIKSILVPKNRTHNLH
jgi:hypothetical protein